ncbi:MAG: hypothetical protein AYK22_01255 [Thermoplasmatales archaeon SG8-52-3]|nr:MAG: hypothetical protein AYK22_01255 [Thermoplasmatales archaeon SG8-52-3]
MKKAIIIIIVILAIVSLFSGCIEEQEEKTISEIAIEFLTEIKQEKLNVAYTYFSPEMKNQFSLIQFENTWNTILNLYGDFQSIEDTSESIEEGYNIIFANCTFSSNYYIIFKIVFDQTKEISGFWTEKIEPIKTYSTPSYVDISNFTDSEVIIGEDPWELPGTISIPNDEGPFPCIVLVQGSGPSDRDETIGVNKPFKDISWGLASNDIIVLRYDKRTKVYPEETGALKNLTLEEEIIDDVNSAIDLLKTYEKVDKSKIFVLGHSLGAMTAPQIALNNYDVSAIIMLASPVRNLEDLIYDQTIYLAELDGVIDNTEQENINMINQSIAKIKSLNISDDELVLGAYKSYWEYLSSYDPVHTAENLSIPIMIVQGLRDYQVTYEDDFTIWNATFSDDLNVFLKTYENLNHLFIAGVGTPTNTEYLIEGHVAEEVIMDMIEFIKGET